MLIISTITQGCCSTSLDFILDFCWETTRPLIYRSSTGMFGLEIWRRSHRILLDITKLDVVLLLSFFDNCDCGFCAHLILRQWTNGGITVYFIISMVIPAFEKPLIGTCFAIYCNELRLFEMATSEFRSDGYGYKLLSSTQIILKKVFVWHINSYILI